MKELAREVFLCLLLVFVSTLWLSAQTEDASRIFNQNSSGVLVLTSYGEDKKEIARGTAFALGEELIVSNYHLVSQAAAAEGLTDKGKKIKVEGIVAVDKNFDLVFLKVKGKIPPLVLGQSGALESGSRIFTLGPDESSRLTISEGTVGEVLELAPGAKLLDSSLAVHEGLSGAPVFDLQGTVVGLNLILEKGLKMILPVSLFKSVPRTTKLTDFKEWPDEDYFSTFEGAYLAGRLFAKMDDALSARRYLEKVVQINPGLIDVHQSLALIYTGQRDYQAALSAHKKVIELDGTRKDSYYGLGQVYAKLQRQNESILAYEKAIELGIEKKEVHLELGNAYEELRDFAKAAQAYEKYLGLQPVDPWSGSLRLGLCRMELGQYPEAVAALEEALKSQPNDVKTNYSLAQACYKAGQLDKAEALYKRLSELNPDETSTYYGMIVKMYDEAGTYAKAIEAAKKIIELNPKSELAVYNLGIMYFKLEKYDDAVSAFRQALAIKPDYSWAWYNIGYSFSKQMKHKESIEAFKEFTELVPDNADGWFNVGIGYMLLKDFEAALPPIQKCIELRPDYGVAHYNLAIVYLNLKDNYSAREEYKVLMRLDPGLAEKLKKLLK